MPTPYLPAKDADFAFWLSNFSTLLTASPTTYGLASSDATAVATQETAFAAAFAAATDGGTRGPATIAAKDAARVMAEATVRPRAVLISLNGLVDEADKVSIGVTVRTNARTPVPAPTTAPSIILTNAVPGVLNLQFRDSTTPLLKSKPAGVMGIELWTSFGTVAATSPAQCGFQGSRTKTPCQLNTEGNAGKITTIFARWFNRSGVAGEAAVGPWSAPLTTVSI